MRTKPSRPEYRPSRWDMLVVAAILALAAVTLLLCLPRSADGPLTVTVSAGGQVLETVPLDRFSGRHVYSGNGYTLTVECADGQVRVLESDCPGRDCVHTGPIRKAGQSIICLPAQIVIRLSGPADGPDLVVGEAA